MNLRKLKRRSLCLMKRAEILRATDIATGAYAGTRRFWRATRPRRFASRRPMPAIQKGEACLAYNLIARLLGGVRYGA